MEKMLTNNQYKENISIILKYFTQLYFWGDNIEPKNRLNCFIGSKNVKYLKS